MKCITSPALDDAQIISYVEGEADHETVTHIKECPYCAERASQWARLQNRLRASLYRTECPSSMELGEYHLGYLPDSQELVVAQHVRQCPQCRREIAELGVFLAEPDVQPDLLETARVLFARLVGGSGSAPALGALRGASKGPLVFEADGVVITLDIQAGPNGQVSILGQVAADDQDQWTGAKVRLQQVEMPDLTADVDDLGAFNFHSLAPRSIQLELTSSGGVKVQIPNINIAV